MSNFEIDQHVWIKNGVFPPLNGVIIEIEPTFFKGLKLKVSYQEKDEFKIKDFLHFPKEISGDIFASKEELFKILKDDLESLQHTVKQLENK